METKRVLQRVREAAQEVREAANSCKVIGLKDEGHSIAQKAQEVLSKIEERVGVSAEQQQQQQQERAAGCCPNRLPMHASPSARCLLRPDLNSAHHQQLMTLACVYVATVRLALPLASMSPRLLRTLRTWRTRPWHRHRCALLLRPSACPTVTPHRTNPYTPVTP